MTATQPLSGWPLVEKHVLLDARPQFTLFSKAIQTF